ncbi:hypothetical protein [Streptomyces natalensis]|uniref:hypothetical protein n=1 Tax=Streptomyces natalensis TaxID=68242 RepID=UPI0012FEC69E|nr:hypothetical protein [Streptomyces natalensis]
MFDDPRGFSVSVSDCLYRYCHQSSSGQIDPDEGIGEDFAEHDDFFGIIRASTSPEVALLGGMALSHCRIVTDLAVMGTTLPPDQVVALLDGYVAVCQSAGMQGVDELDLSQVRVAPLASGDDYRPAARWRVGHQHFFAQLQSITVALRFLATAVACDDDSDIRTALLLASRLAVSAAAGMRYAADFHAEDYASVRESMGPPRVAADFSGLQTRDHYALVQAFRSLPLDAVHSRAEEHERFETAIREMYTAHVYVCDSFGGRDGPSLRMQARAVGPMSPPGAKVAEALAHSRLHLLGWSP